MLRVGAAADDDVGASFDRLTHLVDCVMVFVGCKGLGLDL